MIIPDWVSTLAWIIPIFAVWEGIWKGIALWRAARNHQLAWYVCIIIFNTVGILPIIYIFYFSKKDKKQITTAS